MQRTISVAVAGALAVLAAGCQPKTPEATPVAAADAAFATTLQERLLDAKPGDVIEIPAGRHLFDRSLSLRAGGDVEVLGSINELTSCRKATSPINKKVRPPCTAWPHR